jgi:hypothetical protein
MPVISHLGETLQLKWLSNKNEATRSIPQQTYISDTPDILLQSHVMS